MKPWYNRILESNEAFVVVLFLLLLLGACWGLASRRLPVKGAVVLGMAAESFYWGLLALQGKEAVMIVGWALIIYLPFFFFAAMAGAALGQGLRRRLKWQ